MNYKKKRKIYFYSILLSVILTILLVTIVALIKAIEPGIKTTLLIILLLAMAGVIQKLKSKFDYYDFITKYYLLIENGNDPKKTNISIGSPEWMKNLGDNKFTIYRNYSSFKLYYRFERVTESNKRSKSAIIIIEIIDNILFEDQSIANAINQFEDDHLKKEKFRNHIILQFKNTDSFNEKNIEATQNVSFLQPVKNHYVIIINCLYSLSEKQAFFVHSNTHNPNRYYEHAVDIVNKLI